MRSPSEATRRGDGCKQGGPERERKKERKKEVDIRQSEGQKEV